MGPPEPRAPIPTQEQRHAIRPLLVPHDPGDARTAYYALEHDRRRTTLTLHRTDSGYVDGFLATCVTGANPFQPLVVLRAFGPGTLEALTREALEPGRSYLFSVPPYIGAALEEIGRPDAGQVLILTEVMIWRILRTDPSRFRPLINVLVTQERGAEGWPRWQVRSRERVLAAAGVNWRSSHWAELYVTCESASRARRWDESVLAAASSALLSDGVIPLYAVAEEDVRTRQAAEARGYYDTGTQEFTCVGTMRRMETAQHMMT